jgi:retron-type reverse transcriptase
MKSDHHLFDQMIDRATLGAALYSAAKGKRDRPVVRQWLNDADSRLLTLARTIADQTFRFDQYQRFMVRDPKSREIHAPSFRDRIVHHGLIAATGPTFERSFDAHSYACRRGFGQHRALRYAARCIRTHEWYFKVDIRKYYDSIPHATLRLMLSRSFADQRLLSFFDRLIGSFESRPSHGLPIGALTSQHLGNFFLTTVDRWARQTMHVSAYLRYMDDFVCFGPLQLLKQVQREIGDFLEGLGLVAKNRGELNRTRQGLPFLGFVIFDHGLKLNAVGRQRLRRKMNRLATNLRKGMISEEQFQSQSQSLIAHATSDARSIRRCCNHATSIIDREDAG